MLLRRRRFAILVLTAFVVIAALYLQSSTTQRRYEVYQRSVKSLAGCSEAEAKKTMVAIGMRLRAEARTKQEWAWASDHVSPTPPFKPQWNMLKYTDEAKLARKCVCLYVNGKHEIAAVHLAVEFW